MGWIEEGLLRYAKEKQNPLGTTQGLQLPKRGSPERVSSSNILSRGDLAKDADKIRDRVTEAGSEASPRGEQKSARNDGSLPPDGLKFSQSQVAEGKAKYLKKLNHRGSLRAGLQLPFGSSMGGSGVTILTEDDVVNFAKRGTRFSQSPKGDAGKVADRMNQGARQLTGGEALNAVKRVWSFVTH